jgi:hypothetical protein
MIQRSHSLAKGCKLTFTLKKISIAPAPGWCNYFKKGLIYFMPGVRGMVEVKITPNIIFPPLYAIFWQISVQAFFTDSSSVIQAE